MGYYMTLRNVEFTMKAKNKEKALQAIKDMVTEGKYRLSIIRENVINAKTLDEAFEEFGWGIEREDEQGDVTTIYFNGEKLGDEEILFDTIAPYVKKGSFVEMGGEDGEIWRWIFNGKTCIQKDAVLKWD